MKKVVFPENEKRSELYTQEYLQKNKREKEIE
jgi:hypothetical protein